MGNLGPLMDLLLKMLDALLTIANPGYTPPERPRSAEMAR